MASGEWLRRARPYWDCCGNWGWSPHAWRWNTTGRIVKQGLWPETVLRDGSEVEIVQFVGGG